MSDAGELAAVARRAAEAGGEVAAAGFRGNLDVERKDGKTDLVTRADRESQERVVDVIREAFPDATVVGEEAGIPSDVPEGRAWIVDPIDGTNNFVRGARYWATSVAAIEDGDPLAAANALPACGDVYVSGEGVARNGEPVSASDRTDPERCMVAPTIWWARGRRGEFARACREVVDRFGDLRRIGSAQATLAMVADGTLDGTLTNVVANPWDTVAGVHMVREAGGRVTDLEGERWRHDSRGLVASNGEVHEEVLAAARAIDGDGR